MTAAVRSGQSLVRRSLAALCAGAALLAVLQVPARAETPAVPPSLASAFAALDAAWQAAPLAFTAGTFVSGEVAGYGRFEPRADARFAPGETLVVYAEPVGFGHAAVAGGHRVALLADFEVLNASGQILAAQEGFADLGVTARRPVREFHATLRFAFEGLRPGDYTLVVRLRDQTADKAGTLSLPFTIVAPAPAN